MYTLVYMYSLTLLGIFLDNSKIIAERGTSMNLSFSEQLTWGAFCSALEHCVRRFLTLLTVIVNCILPLHLVNGEGEVCPSPTLTELVWNSLGSK